MSFELEGVTYIGSANADGCVKASRAWYLRIHKNNFFGFSKLTTGATVNGVIVFSADGASGTAFSGSSFVKDNAFQTSGRCVLFTGQSGGVVNNVVVRDNTALGQSYFVAADWGTGGVPFTQNIVCNGNHIEGSTISDYYSQGAASNWVIDGGYIEEDTDADTAPRIDIQGSANFAITVENSLFSKHLANAGQQLIRISNAKGVLIRGNTTNYGGFTDRYCIELDTCADVEAEIMQCDSSTTLYPILLNGFPIASGIITDTWRMVTANISGGFTGVSAGDGFPGSSICTATGEYNKTNGKVWLNFKATVTTKGSGSPLNIGVLPYSNYGNDVTFPIDCTNVTGTKPFHGKLPNGSTVATVYDATGTAVVYNTAVSVGSVFEGTIQYLTQG